MKGAYTGKCACNIITQFQMTCQRNVAHSILCSNRGKRLGSNVGNDKAVKGSTHLDALLP